MKKTILRSLSILFMLFYLNTEHSLAQWVSVGPEGGAVWCMTSCNNILYAATGSVISTGNLYKSADNGATWTLVDSPDLPAAHIYSMTSLGNSIFLSADGIYRSDDEGVTWVKKYSQGAALLASGSNAVFAAIQSNGILRSLDNGETWTLSSSGLTDLWFYSLTARGNMVFAGTGDNMEGVFRSTDNGSSWEQTTNGMAYYDNGVWLSAYAPMITSLAFAGDVLYAGTGEAQGIWKSNDYGDNWVFTSMETMGYQNITSITGNESVVIAGSQDGGGLFRSLDEGTTWMDANTGVTNYGMVYSMLMLDNLAFAGTKGGIFTTADNGSSWTASYSGIKAQRSVYPAFTLQGGNLYFGSETGGVFRSPDEGNTWTEVNNGLPIHEWNLSALFGNPSAIFAWDRLSLDNGNTWDMSANYSPGTTVYNYYGPRWLETTSGWYAFRNGENPAVFRSVDQGTNWTMAMNGINDPANTSYYWIVDDNSTLYLGTTVGIYYSIDGGENWSVGSFPDLNIHALNGACFLGTPTAKICGLRGGGGKRGIYHSADNGANWSQVSELLVHNLFSDGDNLYAAGTNLELVNNEWVEVPRIFHSQDDGLTWSNISAGLNNISTISATAGDGKIFVSVYVAPKYGIYCSPNNGDDWIDISDGFIPVSYVPDLEIINNKLFAGTSGNSVWKRNLSDFTVPAQPEPISGKVAPCSGIEEIYSVPAVQGVNYQWQVPQDWVITGGNGTNAITVTTGASGGLVLVIPSNGFGNGASQYLMVTPATSLEVTATIAADNSTICHGSTMTFTATTVNGGDQPAYNWLVNEVAVGDNAPSFNYIPENGDEISLLLTSSIECAAQNTVVSNTVTALVNDLPAVTWEVLQPDTLCINYSAQLLAGGVPAGGVYSGAGITTGTGTFDYLFNPSVAGAGYHPLTYTYTDANGCSADATQEIYVDWCTGINETGDRLSVYPNPAGDLLHIIPAEGMLPGDIHLYNSIGTELYSAAISDNDGLISLSLAGLPAGSYILKVITANESLVRIIIKK